MQDVFFRILRYRATYDPRQSFTAWINSGGNASTAMRHRSLVAAAVVCGKTVSTRVRTGVTTSAGALRMYSSATALTVSGREAR